MDNYTKGVLTVIAICLVSITFQLSGTKPISDALAQIGSQSYNPIYVKIVNR